MLNIQILLQGGTPLTRVPFSRRNKLKTSFIKKNQYWRIAPTSECGRLSSGSLPIQAVPLPVAWHWWWYWNVHKCHYNKNLLTLGCQWVSHWLVCAWGLQVRCFSKPGQPCQRMLRWRGGGWAGGPSATTFSAELCLPCGGIPAVHLSPQRQHLKIYSENTNKCSQWQKIVLKNIKVNTCENVRKKWQGNELLTLSFGSCGQMCEDVHFLWPHDLVGAGSERKLWA